MISTYSRTINVRGQETSLKSSASP